MPRAVDYLGLVAYMFVMYGGLPGSDSLWSDAAEPQQPPRKQNRLRGVAANGEMPRRGRRSAASSDAQEAAA